MRNQFSAFNKLNYLPPHFAAVTGAVLALLLSDLPSAADDLYANPQDATKSQTCDTQDPLHIKSAASVRDTMVTLGVNPAKIEFAQCAGGFFSTSASLDSTHDLIFRITYPEGLEISQYLAPITHELGHVYQLLHAGSLAELRKQMQNSLKRIELGADFLAGVAFRRRKLPASELILFEQNLMLTGDFTANDHGTPAQRTSAFRMGYFSLPENQSVDDAAKSFQTDGFAQIEAQTP